MFEIIYEGKVIGLVEQPRYVRQKNGVWVQCEGKDATAIALKSHAYEGAFAKETDGGEYLLGRDVEIEQEITEQDLENLEAEQEITDLDLRVMELEVQNESQ